jgi:glutamine amidotransferase
MEKVVRNLSKMIGIIDYGMGNLLSVYSAIDYLGADVLICKYPEDLSRVDRIIIPGVGAFKECIRKIISENFLEALNEHVIQKAKPTLGICLGMQVMAKQSYEGGVYEGLGWFDAEVVRLHPDDSSLRVPNIGWNEINFKRPVKMFEGIQEGADFYLVHSYYMKCNDERDIVATYEYGQTVTAVVQKDNIIATQFHPEKSQDYGLKALENFINWNP